MSTLLFAALQLTILLALSNLLARCFSGRSPQLAAKVSLIGITFATALLPMTILPIPKFEIGALQIKSASPSEMARSALGLAKQLDNTGGNAIGEQTSDRAGGPGFDFHRLLASLRLPIDLSAGAQWRLLSNCMLAWCLLVGLCMLRLVISLVAVLRMNRQSKVYENPQLQRALAKWTGANSNDAAIGLLLSDRVSSPCVTSIVRRSIYVPPDFDLWSEDEQLTALAHEVAHIVRRDAQWRLYFDLLAQFVAFHPLAWLLKRQLVLAQEMAADQYASTLVSAEVYRTGLCRVALRMDSQPQLLFVSFGVSVSTNSLVRRIKMLGSAKNKPRLARRQQFLVIAMFCGSCSSLALCTSGDDDLIRIASRSVPPKAETSAHFNRGASQPWDEIGVQSGYLRLLPAAAAEKPVIKTMMEEVADQLEVSNLECGVKLSRDFLSWTSNLELKIIDRKDNSPDGHRYALSLIGDKPVLEFSREVDWAEVAEKVRWGVFAVEENFSALKKFIHEQGRSKTLRIITNDSSHFGDYVIAKSLWPVVDGGVTAAVFPLAELAKIDPEYKREDVSEVACLNVLRQCRFMGIGVDLQYEESLCQFRLALVPRKEHTAEEILQQVKAALASILETTKAAEQKATEQLSDDEKQSQANWRKELENWRVSTQRVDGEIGEIVLIEGSASDARILIPLM